MYRMSGFMLIVSLAGFLIAKPRGFPATCMLGLAPISLLASLPFIGVLLLNYEIINSQFTVF